MKPIAKNALLNALVSTLYVTAVGSFLFYAPKVLGSVNTALVPIVMLLLFVFSAAFMGVVLFGRPVL